MFGDWTKPHYWARSWVLSQRYARCSVDSIARTAQSVPSILTPSSKYAVLDTQQELRRLVLATNDHVKRMGSDLACFSFCSFVISVLTFVSLVCVWENGRLLDQFLDMFFSLLVCWFCKKKYLYQFWCDFYIYFLLLKSGLSQWLSLLEARL